MSTASIRRRRKLKKENPETYAELLAKEREAAKKYRQEKKRHWEEGTHSQAEIEEYNAQKEKRRLKNRERMRKVREATKLAKIDSTPAEPSDRVGRLKQSVYNLNHKFRAKTKKLAMSPMEYAQTALNLLNPRTPEKKQAIRELQRKHPCRFLFNTQESDDLDVEGELGIQLQDSLLEVPEAEEEISKPAHNMVQYSYMQLFYIRDDVSQKLPHAHYSTKHGAARVMVQTIKSAHQLYKKEHPSLPVSLTLFQTLRPKNVRLLGSVPIDSCFCVCCANVGLMINALNKHLASSCQLPNETEMLRFLTCPIGKDWPDIKCIDGTFTQHKVSGGRDGKNQKLESWSPWKRKGP
ncbi:actin cytoskeleton-regulatory complex protein PAN1 [Biomphalaria glabrata]|nr:actin cytoskeleton-regulatory complex protein PAN1 [Biomphalaria glabrata]